MTRPLRFASMIAVMLVGAACAEPPSTGASDAAPTRRVRPPPAVSHEVKPQEVSPPAVTVDPAGRAEPHPLAPESLPNKPPTIPEEMADPVKSHPGR